jgi:hypothetical protein
MKTVEVIAVKTSKAENGERSTKLAGRKERTSHIEQGL